MSTEPVPSLSDGGFTSSRTEKGGTKVGRPSKILQVPQGSGKPSILFTEASS